MKIKSVSPVLILVVGLLSGAVAGATPSGLDVEGNPPAVIAVKFHADWCGSCKAMGSVFEELQDKFDTLPVLYVVLDHTREFNRQQSGYLAASLGLDEIWEANGGKTGFIMLIDGKTRQHIATLTKEHDLKAMGSALETAVEGVSSSP